MRKNIKTKSAIFPMPVLMIATYNEDGSVDVMNAAWGTMFEMDEVLLNLTETHKTVKNIRRNKAFTVSIADSKNVVAADYFGIVSGNNTIDKFLKSGLTALKSENVNAPIIDEFPISMECELLENESNSLIVGKVVNVSAKEEVLKDGNVDVSLLNAICYDSFTNGYYEVGKRVGDAFRDGQKLK